jgi:hypothetical protein
VYANYCNLFCNINYYDISFGAGSCATLLAGGLSCADNFAPGMQYGIGGANTEGYCDFACGYCPATYTAPEPGCEAFDLWDRTQGASTCAVQMATGAYSCAEHFGVDDSLTGYCNLACQHNFLEHPQVYVNTQVWSLRVSLVGRVLCDNDDAGVVFAGADRVCAVRT